MEQEHGEKLLWGSPKPLSWAFYRPTERWTGHGLLDFVSPAKVVWRSDITTNCFTVLTQAANLNQLVVIMAAIIKCTVLHCTALYSTVQYCTVLYCTVLYCTVLYCTVILPVLWKAMYPSMPKWQVGKKHLLVLSTFSFLPAITNGNWYTLCWYLPVSVSEYKCVVLLQKKKLEILHSEPIINCIHGTDASMASIASMAQIHCFHYTLYHQLLQSQRYSILEEQF